MYNAKTSLSEGRVGWVKKRLNIRVFQNIWKQNLSRLQWSYLFIPHTIPHTLSHMRKPFWVHVNMVHSSVYSLWYSLTRIAESNKVSNIYIHRKQVKITISYNYLVNLRAGKRTHFEKWCKFFRSVLARIHKQTTVKWVRRFKT